MVFEIAKYEVLVYEFHSEPILLIAVFRELSIMVMREAFLFGEFSSLSPWVKLHAYIRNYRHSTSRSTLFLKGNAAFKLYTL